MMDPTSPDDTTTNGSVHVRTDLWRKAFCHEMHLRDMFGNRLDLSFADLAVIFSHRVTISFLVLLAIAMFALDPTRFRGTMPPSSALTIWLLVFVLAIGLKLVNFAAVSVLTSVIAVPIYLPVLSAIEFLVTMVVGGWLGQWFSAGDWQNDILADYPYYVVTLLVIETFYVRYLIPDILRAAHRRPPLTAAGDLPDAATDAPTIPPAGTPAGAPTSPPACLHVGDRRFVLTKVQYVVSEEHYVRIVLANDQVLHRARLADIVAQTGPADGVQPHRSWWICRQAQPRLVKDGGKWRILLSGAIEVPVARARTRAVQDWFDAHADW